MISYFRWNKNFFSDWITIKSQCKIILSVLRFVSRPLLLWPLGFIIMLSSQTWAINIIFKKKLSFIYNYLFISSFFRIKSSSWAELVLWVGLTPQSPLPLHSCSHWGNIYFFYWSGNYEKWESYDWKCGVRVRVSCLLTLK